MSGSLFPVDQSGAIWTVGSMIGLLLFGVTLTVVVDGNMNQAEKEGDAEGAAVAEISRLDRELQRLQDIELAGMERQGISDELRGVIHELAERTVEVEELEAAVETQQEWTEKRGKEFQEFQIAYRESVWKKSRGREIGDLALKNGKRFEAVKITKVSAEGISISHSSGAKKVAVHLLPKGLREELLLNLAESQRIAREKREAELAAIKKKREAAVPKSSPVKRRPLAKVASRLKIAEPADRAEILALREQISGLTTRLSQLNSELSEARGRGAGLGRGRSVPGSLETWEERELRLRKIETRAKVKLVQLDSQLQLLDPKYRPPFRP